MEEPDSVSTPSAPRLADVVLAELEEGLAVEPARVAAALREADRERRELVAAEHRARAQAVAERDRLRFLAGASVVLDATLDLDVALRALAHLVLGRFGGWVLVDLVEQGGLRRAVVANSDPRNEALAEAARSEYAARPLRGSWIAEALSTRRPVVVDDLWQGEELQRRASRESGARLSRDAGIRSTMIVPLIAHDEVLGLLLIASEEVGAYSAAEVESAQELARRAAVSIANARLYSERDSVARILERGLLPPSLPALDGVELAVRYRAAGRGTEVGGDFYDAVDLGHGRCAVLLGDVAGKGAAAAVTGGLARQTARGALARRATAEEVVQDVHRVLLTETPRDAFCTLVAAELEVADRSIDVTLANAGHPLPVVVRTDGTTEMVGRPGGIAGAFRDVTIAESSVTLAQGDLLLIYTDGVTEAGAPWHLLDDDEVCDAASRAAGRSAPEAARLIEEFALEVSRGRQRDDLAVLALRAQ